MTSEGGIDTMQLKNTQSTNNNQQTAKDNITTAAPCQKCTDMQKGCSQVGMRWEAVDMGAREADDTRGHRTNNNQNTPRDGVTTAAS